MWISSFIIYYNRFSGQIGYKSEVVEEEVDGQIMVYYAGGSAHPAIFKDLEKSGIERSDAILLGGTIGEKNHYNVSEIRINKFSSFQFDMTEINKSAKRKKITLEEEFNIFIKETDNFIKDIISSEAYSNILKRKIDGFEKFILNENRFGTSRKIGADIVNAEKRHSR